MSYLALTLLLLFQITTVLKKFGRVVRSAFVGLIIRRNVKLVE